jgi:hypothetical protein
MMRRDERMSEQNLVMLIERRERVRCLVTGGIGGGIILSEHMTGK